jgi:hypothetical protein
MQPADPSMDTPPVEMIVDADDRIVACGLGWDDFAQANGAPTLTGTTLIGTPVLDAITGKVTRAFTQALLARVRVNGQPLAIPYRCDTPTQRRFMRMELAPLQGGGVRLRHWLVRSEPLGRLVRMETSRQRGRETRIRCSLCNLIKQGDDWLEPSELASCLGLSPDTPISVTYGICPACARFAEGDEAS